MISIRTEHPVAVDSPDHIAPFGTMRDNSTSAAFIADLENYFARPIAFLDVGCAGGQLAVDMAARGHRSVGIEGSDWNRINKQPNWNEWDGRVLFTCDASMPFTVEDDGEAVAFDIVSAWEVCEHIHPDRISVFIANIAAHLKDGGLFMASIATYPEILIDGYQLHQSVLSKDEWMLLLANHFDEIEPITDNWVRTQEPGFHLCLRKRDKP